MKILLTAPPGLGKTTVLESVVRDFEGKHYGIIAREILNERSERVGFTSIDPEGKSRQFMFHTNTPTEETIGGLFDVDVSAIDEFVVPELRKGLNDPQSLIFVDEIGRAQAKSALFLDSLREIFRSPCNILATIVYDPEPWSLEFKADRAACMLTVLEENRNHLPSILVNAFSHSKEFERLSCKQKATVLAHLNQLVSAKQFIAASKLFTNAIGYVVEKRIRLASEKPGSISYEVDGRTNPHSITHDTITDRFRCDCDLSNGRGMFQNGRETCSHELSVRLLLCESDRALLG